MQSLTGRRLLIFIPPDDRDVFNEFGNYMEQVLGTVVRPAYEQHQAAIEWIWLGRDDDLFGNRALTYDLPNEFNNNGICSFIDVRVHMDDADTLAAFETAISDVVGATDYLARDWEAYDAFADLVAADGKNANRYIRPDADEATRAERARLLLQFMDATSRMMLHSLHETDGQWGVEPNTHSDNPSQTFFQSVHHLFQNTTNVPLPLVFATHNLDHPDPQQRAIVLSTPFMNGLKQDKAVRIGDIAQWPRVDYLFVRF